MPTIVKGLAGVLIMSSCLVSSASAEVLHVASADPIGFSSQASTTLSTSIVGATSTLAQAYPSTTTEPSSYAPASCGENGPFTITFDDLPTASNTGNNSDYPFIANPYHQLYFSNGYSYSPPPGDPFAPISTPKLAVFLPSEAHEVNDNKDAGLGVTGEISAGPNMQVDAYWFNVSSAYLGCSEPGPNPCQWDVVAFEQTAGSGEQTVKDHYLFQTPPCYTSSCQLTPINFPSTFVGLSGIQFFAYVDESPVAFSMDNLSMGWWNNSCEAGLMRVSEQ